MNFRRGILKALSLGKGASLSLGNGFFLGGGRLERRARLGTAHCQRGDGGLRAVELNEFAGAVESNSQAVESNLYRRICTRYEFVLVLVTS